ncbi:DUF1611 domain-containing protein [Halobellus marinus]|uniref:DUF1611 domain-containing protein n=1 Tax=Halobellus TaxID=1073986 RepID=UPI0031F2D875
MRIVILAHGQLPYHAKTAIGLLRYSRDEIVAVLDKENAGGNTSDYLDYVSDVPIVESVEDISEDFDALFIGASSIGGGLNQEWRHDICSALKRGCSVYSGLHYFLSEDKEFSNLADEYGGTLYDIRQQPDDLSVNRGRVKNLETEIVLTVGTACATGKMTTALELVEKTRERGIDAGFVPTGQTGVMISGGGIVIDGVVSDFVAGAVERLCLERSNHDILFVEGQGSIIHSGATMSLIHGSMPDKLVLCHDPSRDTIVAYDDSELPPVSKIAKLYQDSGSIISEAELVAGALNTQSLSVEDANDAVEAFSRDINVPATDPLRFGVDRIIDEII